MKKMLFLLLTVIVLISCKDNTAEPKIAGMDSTSTSTPANLPYTVDRAPDWEIGNPANVAPAMNALRGYEMMDWNLCSQSLADSVQFYASNFVFKGTRDSLLNIFKTWRSGYESISIRMQDYESVKSKNRGEEWVGLWFVQTTKDKAGKTDSIMEMDDVKIVNGKVAVIDAKDRKLGKQ